MDWRGGKHALGPPLEPTDLRVGLHGYPSSDSLPVGGSPRGWKASRRCFPWFVDH